MRHEYNLCINHYYETLKLGKSGNLVIYLNHQKNVFNNFLIIWEALMT